MHLAATVLLFQGLTAVAGGGHPDLLLERAGKYLRVSIAATLRNGGDGVSGLHQAFLGAGHAVKGKVILWGNLQHLLEQRGKIAPI